MNTVIYLMLLIMIELLCIGFELSIIAGKL